MPTLNVYFIFNLFLFIMGGYLFLKTTPDLMKKRENTIFKSFIIAFGVYIIFNTLWTMQEYDVVQFPKWLFKIICASSLTSVLLNSYCFYKFLMIYFGYSDKENILHEVLGAVPFLIAFVMTFLSIWNGFVFSISDDMNIVQNTGYLVLPICALIYFSIIIVSSIREMVKSKSPQSRKNSLTMILTTIFLIAWVFADNLISGLTIIPIAIFSVILVIFTTFQQSSINTDALTQMNNRRKAMEYLAMQMDNVSTDAPLYVYICDINSFKMINDTFGHLEGDEAIIILANSIKETTDKFHGFAARYGGDEFIIAVKPAKNDYDEKEVIDKVNNLVDLKCNLANKPYKLSITAGFVKCCDKSFSVEACLKEADANLYENKSARIKESPIKKSI